MNWFDYLLTGVGVGSSLAGALALFRLFGKGVAWLMDRDDRRKTSLTARMEAMELKVEALNAKVIIVGGALAEAVADLRQHTPNSANLARYERALRLAFPLHEPPADLVARAQAIDKLNRA